MYNGLQFDAEKAVAVLCKADPRLARVIRRAGPFRVEPPRRMTPFQMLLRSIVYQQLSGRAAATIYRRVAALCANPRFPQPEEISALSFEALRSAGLSYNKTRAVQDLAAKTRAGAVPDRTALRGMPDDVIVERLTQVRGVGVWTVEMLLMFYLGRPDVFPVGDLGVRKGIAITYGHDHPPEGEALGAIAERWRPYRSVGSWYMWRAVGLQAGTESPVSA